MSKRRPQTQAELVEFIRSIDVRAPDALHHRIETLVDERTARGRRQQPGGGPASGFQRAPALRLGGAIAVLAAAAVALAIALTGGGSGPLNVREAPASTLRPATMAAPPQNPRQPTQLATAVDGLAFPYWGDRFGWRSTGARVDRIRGREVTTVFYANRGSQRIGYAILAGTPAPSVGGGVVVRQGGTPYRLLAEDGVQVVAWVRDGRLCVVAGRGVSSSTLLRLASSDDRSAAL